MTMTSTTALIVTGRRQQRRPAGYRRTIGASSVTSPSACSSSSRCFRSSGSPTPRSAASQTSFRTPRRSSPTVSRWITSSPPGTTPTSRRLLWNSLVTSTLTVIVSLTFATFAAYALSRAKFRGRGVVQIAYLAVRIVPGNSAHVPAVHAHPAGGNPRYPRRARDHVHDLHASRRRVVHEGVLRRHSSRPRERRTRRRLHLARWLCSASCLPVVRPWARGERDPHRDRSVERHPLRPTADIE